MNCCLHIRICAIDYGGDLNAGSAIVFQVKVGVGHADEIHIAIQSAVASEVGTLGVDKVI